MRLPEVMLVHTRRREQCIQKRREIQLFSSTCIEPGRWLGHLCQERATMDCGALTALDAHRLDTGRKSEGLRTAESTVHRVKLHQLSDYFAHLTWSQILHRDVAMISLGTTYH